MNMLFANMGSYDWIIFVMAAVNGAVFAVAERSAKSLYESLLPRIHVSSVLAHQSVCVGVETMLFVVEERVVYHVRKARPMRRVR